MKYSDRILKTVALMMPGKCLADIGCDHGYMSVLAAENSLFDKIYACDVKEGPLSRAAENICASRTEDRIQTILSDGFENIPEDATSAVICGMGGLLICKILSDAGQRLASMEQLILGPHSETEELRNYVLDRTGFDIFRETAVFDGGKHYILMDVRPKKESGKSPHYLTADDRRFGTPSNQTDTSAYAGHLAFLLDKSKEALELCSKGSHRRSEKRAEELKAYIDALTVHINKMKEKD